MTALIVCRSPPAPPPTFDYYCDPNGDDTTGNGSFANPWSITALGILTTQTSGTVFLNASNKWSTYKGKRVGLKPGTYTQGKVNGTVTTLYTYASNATFTDQHALFVIQGGTTGASTYIGCSDANGNETTYRTAILDFSSTGNVLTGGTQPTMQPLAAMGQTDQGSITSLVFGNLTINGLWVRGFCNGGFWFNGPSIPGLVLTNNEVSHGLIATSNNNPGGIWLDGAVSPIVRYNKVHDLQTSGGTAFPWGFWGCITFNSSNVVVEHNTFYRVGAVGPKTQLQQWSSFAYNYLEAGAFASGLNDGGNSGLTLSCPSGMTCSVHDNILLGLTWLKGDIEADNEGTINFFNNSLYLPSGAYIAPPALLQAQNTASPHGTINLYNNAFWNDAGAYQSYEGGILALNAPTGFGTVNNNAYQSTITFTTTTSGAGSTGESFAAWNTATGFDAASVSLSSSPFATTPVSPSTTTAWQSTYAISGAAATAGVGGATCGPLDVTNVGCGY